MRQRVGFYDLCSRYLLWRALVCPLVLLGPQLLYLDLRYVVGYTDWSKSIIVFFAEKLREDLEEGPVPRHASPATLLRGVQPTRQPPDGCK